METGSRSISLTQLVHWETQLVEDLSTMRFSLTSLRSILWAKTSPAAVHIQEEIMSSFLWQTMPLIFCLKRFCTAQSRPSPLECKRSKVCCRLDRAWGCTSIEGIGNDTQDEAPVIPMTNPSVLHNSISYQLCIWIVYQVTTHEIDCIQKLLNHKKEGGPKA